MPSIEKVPRCGSLTRPCTHCTIRSTLLEYMPLVFHFLTRDKLFYPIQVFLDTLQSSDCEMEVLSGGLRQHIVANCMALLTLIPLSIAGLYLVQSFPSCYRLRHFKGPRIASLTRLWLARHVAGGTMHLDFQKVNEKYGMFKPRSTFAVAVKGTHNVLMVYRVSC